jgi:hypothetical protein
MLQSECLCLTQTLMLKPGHQGDGERRMGALFGIHVPKSCLGWVHHMGTQKGHCLPVRERVTTRHEVCLDFGLFILVNCCFPASQIRAHC